MLRSHAVHNDDPAIPIVYVKDPAAVLDYSLDWSAVLGFSDTIVASGWGTDPVSIAINVGSFTITTTTVILAGGTVDTDYTVTNHIATAKGKSDERSFIVRVRQR